MASRAVNTGKTAPSKVPTPGIRPDYVLGSRPATLRQPQPQRIKPGAGSSRNYGKQLQPNPAGAGFGDTGQF